VVQIKYKELIAMYSLASTTWDREEIDIATGLLKSGNLTMGKNVREFEEKFAKYIGTNHAIMFNSGSSANLAMIAALKYVKNSVITEGDHVIVPAVSWSTTYYPINQLGFVLDFIDIDLETLNINVNEIEEKITKKTKVIFTVNLLGNPSDLISLQTLARKYNLILIEDNCESLGASINGQMTGSFGEMASHSFFFSHHICTMEGGMVTTNSRELMETLISLRAHGWTRELEKNNSVFSKIGNDWDDLYRFVLPGYNLRPLEISGAIGKIQLDKFPNFLTQRIINAYFFTQLFHGSRNYLVQKEHGNSSWFGFSLVLLNKLSGKRDALISFLSSHNVDTRPIVAGNFTLSPVMKYLNYNKLPKLNNSNLIHNNGLFIGNHHYDVTVQLKEVYSLLMEFEMENS
jgi:CDP-6-deoxy-D-xylo-4-hexulose-3-dehydrase